MTARALPTELHPQACPGDFALFTVQKQKPGLVCGRQTLYHQALQNASLKGKEIQIEVILDSQKSCKNSTKFLSPPLLHFSMKKILNSYNTRMETRTVTLVHC
jgi:hypothetical protein